MDHIFNLFMFDSYKKSRRFKQVTYYIVEAPETLDKTHQNIVKNQLLIHLEPKSYFFNQVPII